MFARMLTFVAILDQYIYLLRYVGTIPSKK